MSLLLTLQDKIALCQKWIQRVRPGPDNPIRNSSLFEKIGSVLRVIFGGVPTPSLPIVTETIQNFTNYYESRRLTQEFNNYPEGEGKEEFQAYASAQLVVDTWHKNRSFYLALSAGICFMGLMPVAIGTLYQLFGGGFILDIFISGPTIVGAGIGFGLITLWQFWDIKKECANEVALIRGGSYKAVNAYVENTIIRRLQEEERGAFATN